MIINIAVIIPNQTNTLLSKMRFQPEKIANHANMTSPIYPLRRSRRTVAITSWGLLVWVVISITRTTSPPIVEGKNKLKKYPPANEIMTLFKGGWIRDALSNISQRKRDNI